MTYNAHNSYWETQVLTATPQKLRLFLIEGAMRFAQGAIDAWQNDQRESGFNAAQRCQDILFELLVSVRKDDSELSRSIVGVYAFLVQEIQPAIRTADWKRMQGILRVLHEERATWQQICEKFPQAPEPDQENRPAEISAAHFDAIAPHAFGAGHGHPLGAGSLSLDA